MRQSSMYTERTPAVNHIRLGMKNKEGRPEHRGYQWRSMEGQQGREKPEALVDYMSTYSCISV